MDSHRSQILNVILSIAVALVVFCVASYLLLHALVAGLGQLQIDFILSAQLLVLILLSSGGGLILAVFVGVKYYRYLRR